MPKKITEKEARAKVREFIEAQESPEAACVALKVSSTTLDNLKTPGYRPSLVVTVTLEDVLGLPPRVWVKGVAVL